MATGKPKILLTNDDGIDAQGINALHEELRPLYDVLVVAPMFEKSGAGCSLSLSNEMEVDARRGGDGKIWGYSVDGTPADCVKFALTALDDYRPDLVVSGVNRGSNLGNSVFYSGTVAAAIEATFYGVRAVACSLAWRGQEVMYFEDAAKLVAGMVPWFLKQPVQPRTLWNLNLPNRRFKDLSAVRLTSHGTCFFEDEFQLYRREGERLFYRNVGTKMVACEIKDDSDDKAVTGGEVSLSLLRLDLSEPVNGEVAESLKAYLKRQSSGHRA